MAEQTKQELTDFLQDEADRQDRIAKSVEKVQAQEEEGYDGFSDTKLKLIPTPNFTDCKSVGTMLPINMASETVTNISRLAEEFDLVEFVREKLNYATRLKVTQSFSSEQVDALALSIKSFEKENAFILGDMAGIGKGRICAGVMRYAYHQGFVPMFVTHKPYLFTDIFRDLNDIGGFGLKDGKETPVTPFILNGNDPRESSIRDRGGNIIFSPLKPTPINDSCKELKLPKTYQSNGSYVQSGDKIVWDKKRVIKYKFNCVFLTYSQISHTKSLIKQAFLEEIAQKSILIFDESHNAASADEKSRIMKRALPLVNKCHAVLFSSATYAKTPDVFGLYVIRTALRTAVPSLESIKNALKVGGENVSEYIASGLVYEGQMIRRERSFGDCKKVTEYVGKILDKNTGKYSDVKVDTQRQFYNEAIGYFKDLRDFSKTDIAASAIYNSVVRKCISMGKDVVPDGIYKKVLDADDAAEKNQFIKDFKGKWVLFYSKDSISGYKATFRENLFLAVKAKFTADKIIECLTTPVDYTNVDGSTHQAPLKPLVAIRNTGEAIFNELDLKEGQELNNDFSEYLQAI